MAHVATANQALLPSDRLSLLFYCRCLGAPLLAGKEDRVAGLQQGLVYLTVARLADIPGWQLAQLITRHRDGSCTAAFTHFKTGLVSCWPSQLL